MRNHDDRIDVKTIRSHSEILEVYPCEVRRYDINLQERQLNTAAVKEIMRTLNDIFGCAKKM